jgi:hypothetical protein
VQSPEGKDYGSQLGPAFDHDSLAPPNQG